MHVKHVNKLLSVLMLYQNQYLKIKKATNLALKEDIHVNDFKGKLNGLEYIHSAFFTTFNILGYQTYRNKSITSIFINPEMSLPTGYATLPRSSAAYTKVNYEGSRGALD